MITGNQLLVRHYKPGLCISNAVLHILIGYDVRVGEDYEACTLIDTTQTTRYSYTRIV